MCGIFCFLNHEIKNQESSNNKEPTEWTLCKDVITARGPDSVDGFNKTIANKWQGYFYASVLWMQGSEPVPQPIVDSDSNILLWNGDVFSGCLFKESICDSETVSSAMKNSNNIPNTLKKIQGPFSFCYYQKCNKLLYFGRDRFGRHSLLCKICKIKNSILLTSVAVKKLENIIELPAIGIFVADLTDEKIKFKCIPWFEPNERFNSILNDFSNRFDIHIDIIESEYLPKIGELSLNIIPNCDMGFLKYTKNLNEYQNFNEKMDYLLNNEDIKQTVDNLSMLLEESVRRRVKVIPNFCKICTKLKFESEKSCQHAKVGLLFSGGLDSAILAVIAHKYVDINETIDLINVAFEKKNNSNYEVPDRITGRQTHKELLKICPRRKFNFIEVNISKEELEKYRSSRISNLVYPLTTVLDDSLACAVWFASRGRGTLYPMKKFYESTCRVLLLGMGADEQFGGYMRHRTILKHKGWDTLSTELKLEFDRISERNLGRDDRMVADHGRQSRLPYLDEDLVNFVQKLSPWERCCPTNELPAGLGDKLLLRLLARSLGLAEASQLPKRAFQFGSRIADSKENAKDPCPRLLS